MQIIVLLGGWLPAPASHPPVISRQTELPRLVPQHIRTTFVEASRGRELDENKLFKFCPCHRWADGWLR